MRCTSCDCTLTDFEATRRYAESGEFVDLCNDCLSTIPDFPATTTRPDLDGDEIPIENFGEGDE